MKNNRPAYSIHHYLMAWGVHLFTASAACLGILTLVGITRGNYVLALCFMACAVLIDAVDGALARLVHVKSVLPHFDGALLDNIVDYLNYVVTPVFFLLMRDGMLPVESAIWSGMLVTVVSAWQFCQSDAKTPDHFFKGFPCYWNITVFYMYLFNTSMQTNLIIILVLCALIFVPIKYVYPSRIDYLTESRSLKSLMHALSTLYGISCVMLLWNLPQINRSWLFVSLAYVVVYLSLSIYRTWSPLPRHRLASS